MNMMCIYQTVCLFSFHSTCKPLKSGVNPKYLPSLAYVISGKVLFSVMSGLLSVHKGVGLSPCDHYGLCHGTPTHAHLGPTPTTWACSLGTTWTLGTYIY